MLVWIILGVLDVDSVWQTSLRLYLDIQRMVEFQRSRNFAKVLQRLRSNRFFYYFNCFLRTVGDKCSFSDFLLYCGRR